MLLDESDNNTRVVLYVGDIVSVRLKSNMTTGYRWNTKDLPSALQRESTLQLNYIRPFEKDTPPAKTFHLLLSIEAPPGSPSVRQ
jgi:predicted secreted protein